MNAPLIEEVDGGRRPRGEGQLAEEDGLVRAGRLALDVAAVVEGQGELDGGVARELPVHVAVAAVDRQEGPVLVAPAQAGLADPAVDLGLDVDSEDRLGRLGPVVDDPEPLEVLPGRDGPAGGLGRQSPCAMKSVARTRIGPFRQVSSVMRRFVAPW